MARNRNLSRWTEAFQCLSSAIKQVVEEETGIMNVEVENVCSYIAIPPTLLMVALKEVASDRPLLAYVYLGYLFKQDPAIISIMNLAYAYYTQHESVVGDEKAYRVWTKLSEKIDRMPVWSEIPEGIRKPCKALASSLTLFFIVGLEKYPDMAPTIMMTTVFSPRAIMKALIRAVEELLRERRWRWGWFPYA